MPETTHPPATEATSRPAPQTDSLRHFIYGAVPAGIAFVAVLWHLLNPYIPITYQGLLFAIATFCGNITLAVWLWCAVQVVRWQFAERDRQADARIARFQQEVYVISEDLAERHKKISESLEKLERSLRGLHRHQAAADEQRQNLAQEVAHLRNLILGTDDPPASGPTGPRRIS